MTFSHLLLSNILVDKIGYVLINDANTEKRIVLNMFDFEAYRYFTQKDRKCLGYVVSAVGIIDDKFSIILGAAE